MSEGGWTLIGQTSGNKGNKFQTWLRSNHNTTNLATAMIEESTYSCIDAIDMAVNQAALVRVYNSLCLYGAVVSKHGYKSCGPGFISLAKLPTAV